MSLRAVHPTVAEMRHDLLASRLNQDRQRWFHRLTGFPLTVVWHPEDESLDAGAARGFCPQARRLARLGRGLPVDCAGCAVERGLPFCRAACRGIRFTCGHGLTTFEFSPQLAGTSPVTLLIQIGASGRSGAARAGFDRAVRLVRLIADELTAAARVFPLPESRAARATTEAIGPAPPGLPNLLVARMLDYARRNYHLPFRLENVAASLGRSPGYLCGLFSRTMGTGFHRYLDDLRLRRAKELLADPVWSVCDVAYAVGYTDANYFRQAFKLHTGSPPSAWRQRHRPVGKASIPRPPGRARGITNRRRDGLV